MFYKPNLILLIFYSFLLLSSSWYVRSLLNLMLLCTSRHILSVLFTIFIICIYAGLSYATSTIFKKRVTAFLPLLLSCIVIIFQIVYFFSLSMFEERFHLFEYTVLGILSLSSFKKKQWTQLLLAGTFGISVGILDELLQNMIPGRVCDVRDMVTNASAVICGVYYSVTVQSTLLSSQKET
jgi:hypothetical protein